MPKSRDLNKHVYDNLIKSGALISYQRFLKTSDISDLQSSLKICRRLAEEGKIYLAVGFSTKTNRKVWYTTINDINLPPQKEDDILYLSKNGTIINSDNPATLRTIKKNIIEYNSDNI